MSLIKSALYQAVRRTGLPPAIIHNYRFRRGTKSVRFECFWCGKRGVATRERFDKETQYYIDKLIAHVNAHEAVAATGAIK